MWNVFYVYIIFRSVCYCLNWLNWKARRPLPVLIRSRCAWNTNWKLFVKSIQFAFGSVQLFLYAFRYRLAEQKAQMSKQEKELQMTVSKNAQELKDIEAQLEVIACLFRKGFTINWFVFIRKSMETPTLTMEKWPSVFNSCWLRPKKDRSLTT